MSGYIFNEKRNMREESWMDFWNRRCDEDISNRYGKSIPWDSRLQGVASRHNINSFSTSPTNSAQIELVSRKFGSESDIFARNREEQVFIPKKSTKAETKLLDHITVQGVERIARSKSVPVKLLWLTLVLSGIAITSVLIQMSMAEFFEYKAKLEITITRVDKLEFPSVTICNYNKYMEYRLNASEKAFIAENTFDFYDYQPDYSGDYGGDSTGVSGFSGNTPYRNAYYNGDEAYGTEYQSIYNKGGSIKKRKKRKIPPYFENSDVQSIRIKRQLEVLNVKMADFIIDNGWQLADAVKKCTFNDDPCNMTTDFKETITSFGACFTFHPNIMVKRRHQRISGNEYGLHLELDINQDQYTEKFKDGKVQRGVRFSVHAKDELPEISSRGLSVPPGFQGFVGIEQLRFKHIVAPWGKCDKNFKLKYHNRYTYEACILECKLNYVAEKCMCKPFFYNVVNETLQDCHPNEMKTCMTPALKVLSKKLDKTCKCPPYGAPACENIQYPCEISYAAIPNFSTRTDFMTNFEKPVSDFTDKFSEDIVFLDIYFEHMNDHLTEFKAGFTWNSLLSEVGGVLGLFVGATVLTIFEIIEYCVRKSRQLCSCCAGTTFCLTAPKE